MEKEGLVRAIKKLQEYGLEINTLVTDRHRQIAKWMREVQPNITHYFDVWHLAKGTININSVTAISFIILGFRKKLLALAKKKNCELIGEWIKSIINHMYWCAMSTPNGDQQLIKAKWLSIINHIHNKHHHQGVFKKCAHKIIHGQRRKKWLKPR